MLEPKLKKKKTIHKIFNKPFLLTFCTIFVLVFVLVGSSYAILSYKTETGLTDVLIKSGNLVATITSTSNTIEMNYTSLGVSDTVGLSYNPYTFTVSNTGNNDIVYYEIRIVDKEYAKSTLPHKSLNYAISKNNGNYTNPQNLGDSRSYIYTGGSLAVGSSDTFNLKLWVNEEYGKYANNKNLVASIELTLYSDDPIDNYIIYDTQGGSLVQKTSINTKHVSKQVPTKTGYTFLGWSETPEGEVKYQSNDLYENKKGITLYAKWKKLPQIIYNLNGGSGSIPANFATDGVTKIIPTYDEKEFLGWSTSASSSTVAYKSGASYNGTTDLNLYAVWTEKSFMNDFSAVPYEDRHTVTEIHFISITDEEIKALDVTTYDLTYNNKGKVTAWYDKTNTTVLYVGSAGKTYLNTGYQLFSGFYAAKKIDTKNMDTSYVTNMSNMFYDGNYQLEEIDVGHWDVSNVTNMSQLFGSPFGGIPNVKELDVSNWDVSNVTNMYYLFFNCGKLVTLDVSGWDVSNVTNMTYMFGNCSSLTTIYANANWQTMATKLTNSNSLFLANNKLVGAVSYNSDNTGISMANPDTGYFTRKS